MSNKTLTVWLILLTAWTAFNVWSESSNRELRNRGVLIREQKFDNIHTEFKSLEQYLNGPLKDKFNNIEANLDSHREYLNGSLRDELNEMKKYLHKH